MPRARQSIIAATPKALRTAPTPAIEQFTLAKDLGEGGLLPIPYSSFTRVIGPSQVDAFANGRISFPFTFKHVDDNAHTYSCTCWSVTTSGCVLISDDPADDVITVINSASDPDPSTDPEQVLLAPWMAYLGTGAGSYGSWPIDDPAKNGVWFYEGNTPLGYVAIWRWYCYNADASSCAMEFEVVLYRNGRIEFRYEPIRPISDPFSSTERGAAIGIWSNGDFRDFLSDQTTGRIQSSYGGAVSQLSWSDFTYGTKWFSSAVTSGKAGHSSCFPAQAGMKARFVFEPRRLPDARSARSKAKAIHNLPLSDARAGAPTNLGFNDRLTQVISLQTSGSMPSGVPRTIGYGTRYGSLSVAQGMFVGDLVVPLTQSLEAASQVLDRRSIASDVVGRINPWSAFNERMHLVETLDVLSGAGQIDGLYSPMRSKTIIEKDFRLVSGGDMPLTSSCVYVLSIVSGAFVMPDTRDLSNVLANNAGGSAFLRNDWKGFNPFGLYTVSGSGDGSSLGSVIESAASLQSFARLAGGATKSLCVSTDYAVLQHERFSLDVTSPFVLEAMDISIPLKAGPSWFRDFTSSTVVSNLSSSVFGHHAEYGGPALTFALVRVLPSGARDIVISGTITHRDDATVKRSIFGNRTSSTNLYVEQRGFQFYGGTPSGVVDPVSGALGPVFSGSARAFARATQGSGCYMSVAGNASVTEKAAILRQVGFVRSPWVYNVFASTVSPFEKTNTSTDMLPDVRRQFRSRYALVDGLVDIAGNFRSDMYDASASAYISDTLGNGTITSLAVNVRLNGVKHSFSPYTVMPGDQFAIIVSKCHPVLSGTAATTKGSTYNISGGVGHDIGFMTGTVSMRFYGSYMRNGVEVHQ